MAGLGQIDWALVALYTAAVLALGQRARRSSADPATEYLLAGRGLRLPAFVGSLVATWYGGLLGIGEIAYRDGVVTWLTQGGFWYLAYLIFALLLAGRVRRSEQTTLPDMVGRLHGESARRIATVLNYFNVVPIAYLLSFGVLVEVASGWPLWVGVLLGALVATVYSLVGGFRAVVSTDLLQFFVMCTAIGILLIAAVTQLGGQSYLEQRLPATHLEVTGAIGWQELVVWATVAMSTLVDPNFYQRCYAARDVSTARRGILIAVGFWLLFDICSVFSGLYARATFTEIDPRLAYVHLAANVLPTGLRGYFFVGLLATTMSTIDSYLFVAGMTYGHDLKRIWRASPTPERVVTATRWGIVVTAILASALALVFDGSIKAIWKTLGSLSGAALLVPMILGYCGLRQRGAGAASMLAGSLATLAWTFGRAQKWALCLRVEALLIGAGAALVAFLIAALCGRQTADAR
ncbi:MAG: sodium:solute symporter family protein [Deltaproteobacteria bacterium]|nr:sodium:solute symporter family protein [Deltaproteobacteria bacterium]